VSAKGKIAAAAAIGALSLMANEAPAQHRADKSHQWPPSEHLNRHWDMFYAKFRNTVRSRMRISRLPSDTSYFQIRTEISVSGI